MTEFGKRIDVPGGRRAAVRQPVVLSAALHSLGSSRAIILSDVSKNGAQLRVQDPMRCGEEVWIRFPPAEIIGTVVWTEDDRCGITFHEPLSDDELGLLQALGSLTALRNLLPEELLAMEDWGNGLAR